MSRPTVTKALEKMEAAGVLAGGGRRAGRPPWAEDDALDGAPGAANEQAAAEFAHRVADIRSGDERHGWRPF
ncbi:hypothetical protein [Streptomyces sp. NPDC004042]|uniref:hypothetical protein n=1 Tax=Streptomyces sp. NPDC004042 TaxID=3154451 RepID=UPI0033BB03B4